MKKVLIVISLCLLTLVCLCACMGGETVSEYKVSLITSSGVTVTSENPVTVKEGETATFTVSLPADYQFLRVSAGEYDPATSTVTVKNVTSDMRIDFYTEKIAGNVLYYDPNGGTIIPATHNLSTNDYYRYETEGSRLKVIMTSNVLDFMSAASLFYDDGTFVREGYILKEYNTKPDGTGEGYSLGSKFAMNTENKVLYCIWAKETNQLDFEYETVAISCPTESKYAPHWIDEGVMITGYKGNDDTVVIPEKIAGKYVIALGEGALTNKNVKTLVMGRRIVEVCDKAIKGCSSLETIYYPDGVYYITNNALDQASYSSLKHLYVNATIAPRYSDGDAAFAIKLARFMACADKPRIAIIGGSSAFQGLSSEYLEALLDGEYAVINFGTTRTTQGYMYLEAMSALADSDDIILYAPENSIYMMGEPRLYWKTLRDLEGMYNVFRYIDISAYENVFSAFAEFNAGDPTQPDPNGSPRYKRAIDRYEDVSKRTSINSYGEYLHKDRASYCNDDIYKDVYVVTLNNRFKSRLEGNWQNLDPNEDYNDESNIGWCNLTDAKYKNNMNRAIDAAKSSGAKVYFSFCPVDNTSLAPEINSGDSAAHFSGYERLIKDNYHFDGLLGTVGNYLYEHKYFYDNAFHLNDYGRTLRTYDVYVDLCDILGIASPKAIKAAGTSFDGCLFE